MDEYFTLQTSTTFSLTLTIEQYTRLVHLSDYFKYQIDFYSRDPTTPFQGFNLLPVTPNHSLDITNHYNILIKIPDYFPLEADKVASFLLLCSMPLFEFQFMTARHLVSLLIVADYFQMPSIYTPLIRQYISKKNLLQAPVQYYTEILTIFGPQHRLSELIGNRFAHSLSVPVDNIVKYTRLPSAPNKFSSRQLRRYSRNIKRASTYFTSFRYFHCTICQMDVSSKPITDHIYDNARVWPCCGSMIHFPCFQPSVTIRRCLQCSVPYYLGYPQRDRASQHSLQRMKELRRTFGISQQETLPRLPFQNALPRIAQI